MRDRDGSAISIRASVSRTERVGVDLPLGLGLRLHGQYEFFGKWFAKVICLWLIMQFRVALLNNGHSEVRCEHARHERPQSKLLAEDVMVA